MKEIWEARVADSVAGVLFLGARKRGRGAWLKYGDLPESVIFYLNLEPLPGGKGLVALKDFRRLNDLKAAIAKQGVDRFGRRLGQQATVWFGIEVAPKKAPKTVPRGVQAIRNLKDLINFFGANNVNDLNRRIYKGTDCGASISVQTPDGKWYHNGQNWSGVKEIVAFTIQTIVEGSDVTVDSSAFELPVPVKEVENWIEDMEAEAGRLWREANE